MEHHIRWSPKWLGLLSRRLAGLLGGSRAERLQSGDEVDFYQGFTGRLEGYSPGTEVTRANFASFLADTFETSKGSWFAQYLWLRYLDRRGTNALRIMSKFLGTYEQSRVNPWDRLSQVEKNYLLKRMSLIAKHSRINDLESGMRNELVKYDRDDATLYTSLKLGLTDEYVHGGCESMSVSLDELMSMDPMEAKQYLGDAVIRSRKK